MNLLERLSIAPPLDNGGNNGCYILVFYYQSFASFEQSANIEQVRVVEALKNMMFP